MSRYPHVPSLAIFGLMALVQTSGCAGKTADNNEKSKQPNTETYSDPLNADSLTQPEELSGYWYARHEYLLLQEGGGFEWDHMIEITFGSGRVEFVPFTETGYWFADEKADIAVLLIAKSPSLVTFLPFLQHFFKNGREGCMILPRQFLPDTTYLITRGATQRELHKYVVRAVNCSKGRWENLWSSDTDKTCVIPLESPEDVLDKTVRCGSACRVVWGLGKKEPRSPDYVIYSSITQS